MELMELMVLMVKDGINGLQGVVLKVSNSKNRRKLVVMSIIVGDKETRITIRWNKMEQMELTEWGCWVMNEHNNI
jgi:hypothetical protein